MGLFPLGSRLSRSKFDRDRDAYSATDIQAVVMGTDKSTKEPVIKKIGDIQTMSYSIHRDATPLRTLGRVKPGSYTMGNRTTAGSLIFATFNRRALEELYTGSTDIPLTSSIDGWNLSLSEAKIKRPTDTIPPFDIILYFTSESGNDSVMTISRVQVMDEGQTFSVQDIYTEHTMQYVADGISMMEKIDDKWQHGVNTAARVFKNAGLIRRATAQGLTF